MKSDDGAVDGSTSASIIPILRPIVLDGSTRFSYVLEVRSTEILVLLDIQPKI